MKPDRRLPVADIDRGFEKVILRLVKGGPERVAIEAGQIDAVVDPVTGNTLLLPDAQQALIERQVRFRSLVGLSSDWYWHQDEQHRFVAYASTADKSSGIWDDDIIGKALWDFSAAGVSEMDWKTHRQQLEWRATFRDLEVNRIDPAGKAHCLSISGEPVFDDKDEFKGYQGITRDITERKRTEVANRHARAALDALATQVAVLDAAGVLLMANRAWRVFAATGTGAGVSEGDNFLAACDAAAGRHRASGKAIAAGIRQVMAGTREQFRYVHAGEAPRTQPGFTLSVTAVTAEGAARVVVSREGRPGRVRK